MLPHISCRAMKFIAVNPKPVPSSINGEKDFFISVLTVRNPQDLRAKPCCVLWSYCYHLQCYERDRERAWTFGFSF